MADQSVDSNRLRRVLGAFMTGVTIITTSDDSGLPRGFTANSFTSVSLEPPLVLACIAHNAFSYPVFASTSNFAVNILAENQKDASKVFAGKSSNKFDHVSWRYGLAGSPVIDGSAAWVDCKVYNRVESGDHLILIGQVIDLFDTAENPLGYCRGAYLTSMLEQDAMPAPGQKMRVGAILEKDTSILFINDPTTGGLKLPTGSSMGQADASDSLKGQLQSYQIDAEFGFIFAVFEYTNTNCLAVYYRGYLRGSSKLAPGLKLFAFDAIPWERISDAAVRSMLKRYVKERTEDQFGIYVGSFDKGQVKHLSTSG